MEHPLLHMEGISKNYPGVTALDSVEFTLKRGEIHALLGENGAGKSTLIKVLTGAEEFESGSVLLNGRPIRVADTREARDMGISTVYQEINLCANLSVAENIFIGREPTHRGLVDWKGVNRRAADLLASLDIDIDVTRSLSAYSVAIQQMVAIARAVDTSAQVLILDEPTSSLDAHEVRQLFTVMRRLKDEGVGIIFVTHFLDQVYEVSDAITVLRNGCLIGRYETELLPKMELVAKMVGKEYDGLSLTPPAEPERTQDSDTLLSTENLATDRIPAFNMKLRAGEVLGFGGLLGSGRTEMARAIFGADPIHGGYLRKKGRIRRFHRPLDAIRAGISYCTEDRKLDGIIPELSLRENIIVALQAKRGLFRPIRMDEQIRIADRYIRLMNVKTPGREQVIRNLSGGNQQKVLIGRWMAIDPEVLILDEPTRGIDVGAKAEIQNLAVGFAEKGLGVVFLSSEIDEMVRCCSRMLVLVDKSIVGEIQGTSINEHNIMQSIAGEA